MKCSRGLKIPCMALRGWLGISYTEANGLLWVLTAMSTGGRGQKLVLCLKLVPGCSVPSHTPHWSLALIPGQVSQRVGWEPPVRYQRWNNIELPSEKAALFPKLFQSLWLPGGENQSLVPECLQTFWRPICFAKREQSQVHSHRQATASSQNVILLNYFYWSF